MKHILTTFTTIAAMGLNSLAYAQTGEDWARFGLGIANQALQGPRRPPGQNGDRHNGGQRAPNSSGFNNMGAFNNNWFRPGNSGFNNNPNYNNYNNYDNYNNYNTPSRGYYRQYSNEYDYPQPQYYRRPQYARSSATYYPEPPVAPKVYSNLPILIRCPSWSEGRCHYSLVSESGRSYSYSISAGERQRLKENTEWQVRYDPGDGSGTKVYRLRGGKNYEFRKNSDGVWAFYIAS